MTQPVIEFWFDFSSSYAYFAALEIEALAQKHRRAVVWRPFMLGSAFSVTGARGLSSTPLKRDYALKDWARIARLRGVTFDLPAYHPAIALPAMRTFYHLDKTEPERAAVFAKAVFAAYYSGSLDSSDPVAVAALVDTIGGDGAGCIAALADPVLKALAKARSDEAIARGVFGSPWFFVDDEPFWGWDRLPFIDVWLTKGGW